MKVTAAAVDEFAGAMALNELKSMVRVSEKENKAHLHIRPSSDASSWPVQIQVLI